MKIVVSLALGIFFVLLFLMNANASLSDGLVAYYPLDGNSLDQTNSYDGVAQNGASYSSGISGQAASFDGQNDYIDLPDGVVNASSGSVSLWFNCSSLTSSDGYIFSSANSFSPSGTRRYIYMAAEELVRGMFMNTVLSDVPISNNGWYHAVLTWSTSGSTFYLNGALKGTGPGGSPSPNKVNLGSYGEGMNSFFHGLIDEVRIYDRVLTGTEVQELYGESTTCIDSASGTVTSNLDIHMPSLNYQTLLGTQNIWADFEYYGTGPNGEMLWKLKDFGTND